MKIVKTVLGYDENNNRLPDIVLDDDVNELIIENGDAVIVIRGHRDGRFVILNKEEPFLGTIRRMFIEPLRDAILLSQYVIQKQEEE